MKRVLSKHLWLAWLVVLVAGLLCDVANARADCPTPTKAGKLFVCHHTGSADNPYVRLEISASAEAAHSGHGDVAPGTDLVDCDCTAAVVADADLDDVADDLDNCPQTPNSAQEDGDADGIGDACDVCPSIPDPLNDIDADGFCADHDNCPEMANEDQFDGDADGIGDVCDTCPLHPSDAPPPTITFETYPDACGADDPSNPVPAFHIPVSTEFLSQNIDIQDIGGSNPRIGSNPAEPAPTSAAFDPDDHHSLTTGIFAEDVGTMRVEFAVPPNTVTFRIRGNENFLFPIDALDPLGAPIPSGNITRVPDPDTDDPLTGEYDGTTGDDMRSEIVTIVGPIQSFDVSPNEDESTRLIAIDNLTQGF